MEERTTGSWDLWEVSLPADRGPEENLRLWQVAEEMLDGLAHSYEALAARDGSCEGAQVALTDAYNRCVEERRRCEDLLHLHEKWSQRRVGGVIEPTE